MCLPDRFMLQNTNIFRNVEIYLPDTTSRTAENQIRLKNVWCKALNKDSSCFAPDFSVPVVFFGSLGLTFPGFSPSLTTLMDSVLSIFESLRGVSEGKARMKAGRLSGEHRE